MYSHGRGSSRPVTVVPPKEKKALTITDKDGNVIDLKSGKKISPESNNEENAVEGVTDKMSSLQVASAKANDAGSSLRKAAEEAIKAGSAKKLKEEQEKEALKKAEEESKKAAEEAERVAIAEEEARKKEEAERLDRERSVLFVHVDRFMYNSASNSPL